MISKLRILEILAITILIKIRSTVIMILESIIVAL